MTTEPPLTAHSDKKSASGDEVRGDGKSRQGSGNSGRGSHKSSSQRMAASPATSLKDNPAADLRNMRRIIAEDPEWSLATVPMMFELCIKHVVENFESKFILKVVGAYLKELIMLIFTLKLVQI